MAVVKYHGDGSTSFSSSDFTATGRSWFPDVDAAYDQMRNHGEERLKKYPGSELQVIAFNRV